MAKNGKSKPNGYWTDTKLKEEALKYKSRDSFGKGSPSAYVLAHKRGNIFWDDICSHMPKCIILRREEKPNFKWSLDKLIEEALKYGTREDFKRGNMGAYGAAVQGNDYDLICAHMPSPKNEAYNDEELVEITSRYNTISDLVQNYPGAYGVIKNKKSLAKFCSHMKRAAGSSKPENLIREALKSFFPNIKKIRDMNVSIFDKPYIFGFEIDMFFSDLNKGIEFDGKYHHTFEYMRKDKSKRFWSDEDIRKYDDLKDRWFATKDIEILHIKEKDWNSNRSDCISRIEQFLGIAGFMSESAQRAA